MVLLGHRTNTSLKTVQYSDEGPVRRGEWPVHLRSEDIDLSCVTHVLTHRLF